MSKEKPFHFHDNRRVFTTEHGGEFLSVHFAEESEFAPGGVRRFEAIQREVADEAK